MYFPLLVHIRKDSNGELCIRSSVCHPPIKIKVATSILNALKKQEDKVYGYGLKLDFLDEKFVKIMCIPTCLTSEVLKVQSNIIHTISNHIIKRVSIIILLWTPWHFYQFCSTIFSVHHYYNILIFFKVNGRKLQHLLLKLMEDISLNVSRNASRCNVPKTIENVLNSIACRGMGTERLFTTFLHTFIS